MQKFTRPLTREIELAGQRLALTFSDKGLSLRPVGSRKPPREFTWGTLVLLLSRPEGLAEATDEQIAEALRGLAAAPSAAKAAPESAAAPAPEPESEPKPEPEPPPSPAPSVERKTGEASVPALLKRLETWLRHHRPRFAETMSPGAGDAELQALEAALGRPIPDDLRALLKWHNGQSDDFVGCFYERWFLMSSRQIADFHAQMVREMADRWRPEWVPFLDDNRDDAVFLDTSRPGPPVREFWERNPKQETVAPSLAAWLGDFVTAVEAGQFAEDKERGNFVRSS